MKRVPEPNQTQQHTSYLPHMKPVLGFLQKTMAGEIAAGLVKSVNAERGHLAAFLLSLLCTVLCCPATALQPAARFPVTIVWDLLYPLISDLVDPIVGNGWQVDKRGFRCHSAKAKGESISSWFGFLKHGLSPEDIDVMRFVGSLVPDRRANNIGPTARSQTGKSQP